MRSASSGRSPRQERERVCYLLKCAVLMEASGLICDGKIEAVKHRVTQLAMPRDNGLADKEINCLEALNRATNQGIMGSNPARHARILLLNQALHGAIR